MKKLIIALGIALCMITTTHASNGMNTLQIKKMETNMKTIQADKNISYQWEIESNYGKATGTATSLKKAVEMIALAGENDITTFRIIISK